MQLLRRLESENARLEATLEWRRREVVFWPWMVSMLGPLPSPTLPSCSPSLALTQQPQGHTPAWPEASAAPRPAVLSLGAPSTRPVVPLPPCQFLGRLKLLRGLAFVPLASRPAWVTLAV